MESDGNRSSALLFFQGKRLEAEVVLHAQRLKGQLHSGTDFESGMHQLQRAWGRHTAFSGAALPPLQEQYEALAENPEGLKALIQQDPDYPDPLLLWAIRVVLPTASCHQKRRHHLQRIGWLLLRQFPGRLDLLLALVMAESASDVLRSLPNQLLSASAYYTNVQVSIVHVQSLWMKGAYGSLFLVYLSYQMHARWFPSSDYVLRCFTVLGEIDRVDMLFRALYERHAAELQPITLSNMLFTALGLERVDQGYVAQLVGHWRRLTRANDLSLPHAESRSSRLSVQERPTLLVVSADLRMHPVGRFWLPVVQKLRHHYRVVHLGFNPHDSDPIRDALQASSHGWHLLECTEHQAIDTLLKRIQPDILLDLGGHTADNRPGLLNRRYAPVQATYLGFYGPSYGEQCDWWVLDAAIARRVRDSYPGGEPIWELPGPSLCYDPSSHGLPDLDSIVYSEPDHPVIGSFNHTRKLTSTCIQRFGSVLQELPQAVLQFRSHSFADPAVRRWFLRQFLDAGIGPEQLQPLTYAPSGKDALRDYGRIHLHLDSYPVSGTTTTLDSLAMGIPVLSSPNNLYAGAISAAILEHVGLEEMVCEHPRDLPGKARELCRQYTSAAARRQLAARVRNSAVCDTRGMPAMFAKQLGLMLRRVSQ